MVGLVLVSHSAAVAEGAAALARQMGGENVLVEPAGGLDLPDRPIGTDAVLVAAAIDRAWSDDGVLVLMDLGSAVLSAEMALDMIDPGRRDRIRLSSAPFVEGAVAAAVAARLGRSLDEVAEEARGGLSPKSAHLGDPSPSSEGTDTGAGDPALDAVPSIRLVVGNRLGLHARPAARFVTAASRFDATVRVRDLTNGRGPADARSLNAVATLGVLHGHEIEVSAAGVDSARALEAVRALAEANFGDDDDGGSADAGPPAPRVAEGSSGDAGVDASDPRLLRGIPASAGVVVGPARVLVQDTARASAPPPGDPSHELARFEAALAVAADGIRGTRTSVAARTGEQAAEIFDAHLLLLADDELVGRVRRAIAAGRPAVDAWREAVADAAGRWRDLDDPYLRSRAQDVEAVGEEVVAALLSRGPSRPSGAGVLVASDLTPAQTASLDPALVTGLATARGSPTSHAAVLARSLGLPAVVAIGDRLLDVSDGTDVLLDGEAGTVRIAPDDGERALAEARAAERRAADVEAHADSHRPATTLDGVTIPVLANVGRPDDGAAAVEAGADGVGLLRTEFLFLDRARMPDEDEQVEAYSRVARVFEGRPVVLRTLDVGGDKPLAYLPTPPEANPFLGVRGLRLGLERPEMLRVQLRAAARVAAAHPLRVMFPMVSTADEVRRARAILDEVLLELGDRAPGRLEVGVMIEVPAAALAAGSLAALTDFFSIGTNDLAQYTLAAERGNDRVAALADALHPAVLRLIEMTAQGAAARGLPVAVCGEVASDLVALPILAGLGVSELSVAPPAVARVKATIRTIELDRARALARRALELDSATEVRALVS
jgi:multiphosphoryl transfer protein